MAWPPVYFVLTDESGKGIWPDSMDVLPWLLDSPDLERTANVLLPALRADELFSAELSRDFTATSTKLVDGRCMIAAP
jgi:hypothetical protein